jgi:hypothetical protein
MCRQNTEGVSILSDFENEDLDEDKIPYFYDSDEIELEERVSIARVLRMVSSDSMPILVSGSTSKKQKFAKRQIIEQAKKTRFWLEGYGFKARHQDSSRVKAFIGKVEIATCEIVSWSDSAIIVDVPPLTDPTAILKTFSLKLKVYFPNKTLDKPCLTRVKSRTAISRSLANLNLTLTESDKNVITWLEKYRKDSLGLGNLEDYTVRKFWEATTPLGVKYVPKVGDILINRLNDQGDVNEKFAGVIINPSKNGKIEVLVRCSDVALNPAVASGIGLFNYKSVPDRAYNYLETFEVNFDTASWNTLENKADYYAKSFQSFYR